GNGPLTPATDLAPLQAAITARPPAVVPPTESSPPAPAPVQSNPVGTPLAAPPVKRHGLFALVLPAAFLLTLVFLSLIVTPILLARWRLLAAQSEAETAYLKRRAELKAEAEAAERMIEALDKRVNLVSLGFREVVRKVTPQVVNVANYREARLD